MYSPITPKDINCTPLKRTIAINKLVYPCGTLPKKNFLTSVTKVKTMATENEKKPNRVINLIGNSLKLKIPLYASLNNILNEYLEEPAILSSLSYSIPICLKPTQVLMPLIYLLSSGILFKISTTL